MFVHLLSRNALAPVRVLSRAGQEMDPGAPAANTATSQWQGIQGNSNFQQARKAEQEHGWAVRGGKVVVPAANGDPMFADMHGHLCSCTRTLQMGRANSAGVLC